MTSSSAGPHDACRLLRSHLAERGWSVDKLAEKLGWEVETLEAFLEGETTLDLGSIEYVLETLDVSPVDFFRRLYREQSLDDPGDDPGEPLTRDEVEALVAEMKGRLRGARRMAEARKTSRNE